MVLPRVRPLLAQFLLVAALAACGGGGGGGGLTQKQADDCNAVSAQEKLALPAVTDATSTDPNVRLAAANKLNSIALEVAKSYAKESGAIKAAIQGVGASLLAVSKGILESSDGLSEQRGVLTAVNNLRVACQIKG